jgi:signal peptidase I
MLSTITAYILSALSDISQNPVSLLIFTILAILIIALVLAMNYGTWRKALIQIKLLEENESPSSLLLWIIGIIILVKIIQGFIIQPFIVDGGSMLPTYHDKEFLLVDKFSYLVGKPHRGDVMIFKLYEGGLNPYNGKYLIKRVIGLPGERVVVQNGITTIYNQENPNGFTLDESYITYKDLRKNADTILDDNHYFMMGDNRTQSYDSRDWGALDRSNIKGQVLLRVFPLSVLSYEPGQYKYDK